MKTSSRPASSTPAALLHLPPAGVKEGAGVDEVGQPVVAGIGGCQLAGPPV